MAAIHNDLIQEKINDSDNDNLARISMFDVIYEKIRSNNEKALIHRLLYIGKLKEDLTDRKEVGDHFERLIKGLYSSQHHVEIVTGLLLVYPQHFIHLLEGPGDTLRDIMQDMEAKENRGSLICQSKILLFMSKVPSRMYSQWHTRVLNIPAIRMDETKKSEPIENQVSETLAMSTKLGYELAKLPKLAVKGALDQLVDKYRHLLTPQDILDRLSSSKELLSPSDYLRRYHSPIRVTLDSELVWPAETKLFRQ